MSTLTPNLSHNLLSQDKLEFLIAKAKIIRKTILDLVFQAKASHVGSALSVADILTALYFEILNLKPEAAEAAGRDRLILSKGHAVTAFYATLAERGFFERSILDSYGRDGSFLAKHIVRGAVPAAEASTGSGGHGLSLGLGLAIAAKIKRSSERIFVVSGDGELEEGSVWEAALAARARGLNNLVLVIDRNRLQDGQDGQDTEKISQLDPLDRKFEAFGWEAEIVDGHNFAELLPALARESKGSPRVVIAKTIKGKGVSFMENGPEWHGKSPNPEEYIRACAELS